MEKHALIRTIYLYLFACLGLVLLTIGSVNFLNMGLKTFVFTKADDMDRLYGNQMPTPYMCNDVDQTAKTYALTKDQKQTMEQFLVDYKAWKEKSEKYDIVAAQRQRDASINLSLIIIGLPLYLYHWGVIKRDVRAKKEGNV